jgi:hypothetical protein
MYTRSKLDAKKKERRVKKKLLEIVIISTGRK